MLLQVNKYHFIILLSIACIFTSCKSSQKSFRGYLYGCTQYSEKEDAIFRRNLEIISSKGRDLQVCNAPVVDDSKVEFFYVTSYCRFFTLPHAASGKESNLVIDSAARGMTKGVAETALRTPNFKVIFDNKKSYQLSTIEQLASDINQDLQSSDKGWHSVKVITVYNFDWMFWYNLTLLNLLDIKKDPLISMEYDANKNYTISYFLKKGK